MMLHQSTLRSSSACHSPWHRHAVAAKPTLRPSSSTASRSSFKQHMSVLRRATDDFKPDSPQDRPADAEKAVSQPQQPQEASSVSHGTASDTTSRYPFPHETGAAPAPPLAGAQQGQASAGLSNKAATLIGGSKGGSSNVQDVKGPNWHVLPHGASSQPPEAPCRPVEVTEANPMGEFGEFEAEGAAAFFLERYKEFGPVFSWQMGPIKMTTIVDYDAVKSLLMADNKVIVGWNPEPFYMMLGEITRESMENPPVRIANRRIMQPAFTKDAMVGYIDKLVGICRTQLEAWSSTDGPVDLPSRGKDLSFEFSTKLLVDFQVSPEQKPALRAKFDNLFQGLLSPPDPTPGSRFSKGLQARGELLKDIGDLVKQREEGKAAVSAGTSSGDGAGDSKLHKNVLDYVLDDLRTWNDGKLSYEAAAGSGIGLIIAGNDTSGLGVSALLATLPLFPDVLKRLRQEQQQVIAKHGPSLTPAALEAMSYADAVIREVLRITPPSASVFRKATVDLEVCGKYIPAGAPLLLSTFMSQVLTDPHLHLQLDSLSPTDLQALEDNWASINAHLLRGEFKPDRWLGTGGDKPSGLLTFSAGPHVCLGMGLFFAEAKVLLALLAREYDITQVDESSDGVGFQVDFMAKLQKGSVKFSKLKEPVAV